MLNSKSTVKGVLEQIIANTIKKAEKGTIEWFDRGINHATFPKPMLLDVALRPMYSKAVKDRESLRSFVTATYEVSNESNIVKERAHEMMQHCREFIDDVDVQVSKCGEECERELQSEEHKDEEEEMDIPTEAPYSEVDWSFDKAFTATDELFNMQIFRPITVFISESLSEEVNSVRWSDNLYCTENFWRTTQSGACYLRPVNAFLMIPGGRVVLVSEYETDKLLPHWWALRTGKVFNTKGKVQLCHLSMVMRNTGIGRDISPTVPVDVLTSAKLFQGHVAFEDTEVTYLEKIFEGMASRPRILEILQLRNRLRYFERSSLDYFSIRHDFLNRNGTPVALKSE